MGLRSRLRAVVHGIVGGPARPIAGESEAAASASLGSWGGGGAGPLRNASPGAHVDDARAAVSTTAPADHQVGWADLGPTGPLAEGRPVTRARPGGGSVVVFLHGGQPYATDNACTHEDGPVGEGEVHGTCVRCPYHDWEFDFTTGACRTDPERPLATWSVAIRGGRILLGPQLRSGTPHRGGDHNDGMETIVQ